MRYELNRQRRRVLGTAVAAALVASAGGGARAAERVWDGGGADNNWTNAVNWAGDAAPVATDVLSFGGTVRLTPTNDFAGNTQFNGINFLAGAGSFTLGGNAVLLSGDINNNSGVAQAISFAAVPVSAATLTYQAGGLVLDGSTVNVNSTGGALSLGQVTFGAAPMSANVSALNVNADVSMAGLTVQTNNATANVISVAAGKTLTVAGPVAIGAPSTASGSGNVPTTVNFTGGGHVAVTAGNFYVGQGSQNLNSADRNVARVDMTGLAGFSYTGGANFGVGWMTRPDAQLRLSPGTNTIVAGQVQIGSSGVTGTTGSPNNTGTTATLFLGAGTNVINTATLTIGNIKGSGAIDWVDAAQGTVTIAGQAGGTNPANITIGRQSSATGTSTESRLALAGHEATVYGGNVLVGHLNGATGSTATGAVTFDRGTFNAASLQVGVNQSGTSTGGVRGTFTLGTDAASTGVLNVTGSFLLGNDTNGTDVPTVATFVMNGGTANVNADIQSVRNGANAADDIVLTLNGGTLNMMGHNIGSSAAPVKTINLTGGAVSNVGRIAGNTINVGATSLGGAPTLVLPAGGTLNAASPLTLPSGGGLEGGAADNAATVNGDVTVAGGSRLAPGTASAAGRLQFQNNLSLAGGSTLVMKLSPDAGSGNDQIAVAGNLGLAGTVNLDLGVLGTGASVGSTYTLITYGGTLTGNQTNFSIAGVGSRKTFTVVPTATTPNSIQVSVGGQNPLALTWVGNGSNNWALQGPSNFKDGVGPQQFFNLDQVTFDDSSTNLGDVQLVGTLLPSSVTVNASRNYRFAGSGSITGATGLTKQGTGTLVVATNNTYSGTTDIQQGTVQVGDGAAGGSLGTGPVNNNGALVFAGTGASTVPNAIGGGGAVTFQAGTVTLTSTSTYTGATVVKGGATVRVGARQALGDQGGGEVTVESGGTLDLGAMTSAIGNTPGVIGSKNVRISGTGVAGAGALANTSSLNQLWAFQNITLDADALIKGARMDVGRDTNFARSLNLNGHTLTLDMQSIGGSQAMFAILGGTAVSAGNIVVAGGALGIENDAQVPDNGGTITFNAGTNAQFFRTTEGSAAKPMVFLGNNVIGGGSNTGAEPVVNANITLKGNVTIQGLASGAPAPTANNPITFRGNITQDSAAPVTVTKAGPFTATLAGTNSWAGPTNVNGGTLSLNGSLSNSNVNIAAGATVNGTGTLNWNLVGNVADQIVNLGTLDITGLNLSLHVGGSQSSSEYVIANNTGGTLTGSAFASVLGLPTGASLDYDGTASHPNSIVLMLAAAPSLPGDVNSDGFVNQLDLNIVGANWLASGATKAQGDANGDTFVNQLDLNMIGANWLAQAGAVSALSAVPEPAAAVSLLLLTAIGGVRRSRRAQR